MTHSCCTIALSPQMCLLMHLCCKCYKCCGLYQPGVLSRSYCFMFVPQVQQDLENIANGIYKAPYNAKHHHDNPDFVFEHITNLMKSASQDPHPQAMPHEDPRNVCKCSNKATLCSVTADGPTTSGGSHPWAPSCTQGRAAERDSMHKVPPPLSPPSPPPPTCPPLTRLSSLHSTQGPAPAPPLNNKTPAVATDCLCVLHFLCICPPYPPHLTRPPTP